MPTVALAAEFFDAFAALPRAQQRKVREFSAKFLANPASAAIHYSVEDQLSDHGADPGLGYYPGSKEGHIPTRSASEGSGAFPSLARRVNMRQHAELPCRGNMRILQGVEVDDLDGQRDDERGYRSLLSGPEPEARHFSNRSEERDFLATAIRSLAKERKRGQPTIVSSVFHGAEPCIRAPIAGPCP